MLPTKLYHYSETPIKRLRKNFYEKRGGFYFEHSKPTGLWFSVEDYEEDQNWYTWCKENEFRLPSLKHKYLVTIKKNAKMLYLSTEKEIEDFGIQYQANDQNEFDKYVRRLGREPYRYVYQIRWEEVKTLWDGIIISPYNWKCRHSSSTHWYYGWDCASGCIWNVKAIKNYKLEAILEEKEEC